MKRSNMLGAYLETKQEQRRKRAKRQKRMAAGLPDSAPLKAVPLSAEQKQAVSAAQTAVQEELGKRKRAAKPLALVVSAGFHVLFGWLIAIFLIQAQPVDNEKVSVDLFRADPVPEKRRIERDARTIKREATLNKTALPQQRVTTTAQIPSDNSGFTIPSDDLTSTLPTDVDGGPQFKGIDRKPVVRAPETRIASTTTSIAPARNKAPSLSDQIQKTTELPDLDLAEPKVTATTKKLTQQPRFRQKKKPKYPELARRAQKEGVVVLEATIGTDGIATDIKVVQKLGHGCDEAAIAALKASRFVPAKRDEKTVAVRISIPYRFELEDSN